MKLPGASVWTKGEVIGDEGRRSYELRVNGDVYRRNRRQLIATHESPGARTENKVLSEGRKEPRSVRNRKPPTRFRN